MFPYPGVVGLLRDEVEDWERVAREGEFRADEDVVDEDLSLREKRPIVADVVQEDREWGGVGGGLRQRRLRTRVDEKRSPRRRTKGNKGYARGIKVKVNSIDPTFTDVKDGECEGRDLDKG